MDNYNKKKHELVEILERFGITAKARAFGVDVSAIYYENDSNVDGRSVVVSFLWDKDEQKFTGKVEVDDD